MIIIIKNWYLRKGVCKEYIYNIKVEVIWTILPILFVMIIVIHSITVIYNLEINKGTNNKYINLVGNLWYWIYNNILIFKPYFNQPLESTHYDLIREYGEVIFSNFNDPETTIEKNNNYDNKNHKRYFI
jgi:heme/copper-type cytochrome/quinol oxidase subunit 2